MSCNCSTLGDNGKDTVDLVRGKGKADLPLDNPFEVNCSCNNIFKMKTLVDKCPHCNMTYGITPCKQADRSTLKSAGINY